MKRPLHYSLFKQHKINATRRGVPFKLSFEQWLKIWQDSGHLHERGSRKGQYCMARFGDEGPYSIGNVKIILHTANSKERKPPVVSDETRWKLRLSRKRTGPLPPEWCKNIADGRRGSTHSDGTKRKMSEARKKWWKSISVAKKSKMVEHLKKLNEKWK